MADEIGILEEDDPFAPSTEAEDSALAAKLSELKARCESAKIEFKDEVLADGKPYLSIFLQAGRAKRRLGIFGESKANKLLSMPFEQYRFLAGYDAVVRYDEKCIEASLTGAPTSARFTLERLQRRNMLQADDDEARAIEIVPPPSLQGRPTIEIGPISSVLEALVPLRSSRVSMKLKGISATTHDQAIAELRSYADSIFFQIDILQGSTFALQRERRIRPLSRLRRRVDEGLTYPTTLFNHEAMSLYWYAKSARDMPLLRFLAFYQAIEFYFPRYSQSEARKRVASIVKNPTFRPHKDDDLDRIISAVHSARSGGFGNERSQLRAVVSECLSANDVREYVTSAKEVEDHFAGKTPKAKYHKIPAANKAADLRNDVADRIYDIRCKIVHTKNDQIDDDLPMILPFSEDADYLLLDIDLVEFVAKSVLVASGDNF